MTRPDVLPPTRRSQLSATAAVVAVYAAAIVVLVVTETTHVRHSADHAGTVPIWSAAVPAIIAVIVARLVPPRPTSADRGAPADATRTRRDAIVLAGLGVAFTVSLVATAGSDLVFLAGKLSLLVAAPLVLLRGTTHVHNLDIVERWRMTAPIAPVVVWLGLAWLGPFAPPSSTVEVTALVLLGGFLLNAVVEEVFYRVWLQTRLEHLLGRWPAIGMASLLWASWHVAIQGTGRPVVDLAVVTVRLGATGLLLGYLWSRYRVRWPLLVVHGAVNAPPALLTGALPWT